MKSRDLFVPNQRRDLLQEQRQQKIGSSIVQVGDTQMRLYHANSQLFPPHRAPLVDPRQRILRERGVWDVLAPRDPDPGFRPRHVITEREMDQYRKMVKD